MRGSFVILISYLLGSIPFGYLIVRALEGGDIRQTGSGGTGATNVSRRAGKAAGILTLLLDALKGATAVLLAMWVFGLIRDVSSGGANIGIREESTSLYWWVAMSVIAVLLGHIFPIWLRFRGGKGVATGVGAFLVLAPVAILGALLIFVAIVFLKRYVSLGSITAALAIPLLIWLEHLFIKPLPAQAPILTAAIAGAILIVFAHRENIRRLMQGKESKFR